MRVSGHSWRAFQWKCIWAFRYNGKAWVYPEWRDALKTADEVYVSGMFTIARVGSEEVDLGPALERAGLVLVRRSELEDGRDERASNTPSGATLALE